MSELIIKKNSRKETHPKIANDARRKDKIKEKKNALGYKKGCDPCWDPVFCFAHAQLQKA